MGISGRMLEKVGGHWLTEKGKVFIKGLLDEDRWQRSYYAEYKGEDVIFTVSSSQANSWLWSMDFK